MNERLVGARFVGRGHGIELNCAGCVEEADYNFYWREDEQAIYAEGIDTEGIFRASCKVNPFDPTPDVVHTCMQACGVPDYNPLDLIFTNIINKFVRVYGNAVNMDNPHAVVDYLFKKFHINDVIDALVAHKDDLYNKGRI